MDPNSSLTFIIHRKDRTFQSQRKQRSIINRHVSNTSHRRRKENKLKSLYKEVTGYNPESETALDGNQQYSQLAQERSSENLNREIIRPKAHQAKLGRDPQACGCESCGIGSRVASLDNDSRHQLERRKKHQSLLVDQTQTRSSWTMSPLQICSGGLRTDPFRTIPGHQTPGVEYAVDYYVQVLAPAYDPFQLTLRMVNPMMAWLFPLMLHHAEAFHAGVAVTQTHLDKRRSPGSPPSKEVDFHRWQAMSLLHRRLSKLTGPPDDAAIVTVLSLACLDMLYREQTTNNRRGLALMVALRGGLDKLGSNGLVKALLVQLDYFWVLEGSSTIFPFSKYRRRSTYPTHPFNPKLCMLIAALPTGFGAIACQRSLREDVLQILCRVALFLAPKTSSAARLSTPSSENSNDDCPDIFDVCSCLQSSTPVEYSLEKSLCLAVILFSFNIHWLTERVVSYTQYRASRSELTKCLLSINPKNAEEKLCLVWIWIVVLDSWKVAGVLDPQGLSLSYKFINKFRIARQWDKVEVILRQFFWHEALAQEWRKCWHTIWANFDQLDHIRLSSPSASGQGQADDQPGSLKTPSRGEWQPGPSLDSEFERDSRSVPSLSHRNTYPEQVIFENSVERPTQSANLPFPSMLTLDVYLRELNQPCSSELPARGHETTSLVETTTSDVITLEDDDRS